MVVIGYNYESKIIGIVNAESEKLAMAFWHGREYKAYLKIHQ